MREQMEKMKKMGGINGMMEKIKGMGKIKDEVKKKVKGKEVKRMVEIIN